jgi:hypothetical protein
MRMNRKWQFAGLILALVACAAALKIDVNNPILNGHIEKLRAASSVTVSFSVNRIGNELEDHKLVLAKPGLVRWETPSTLVIANGTSILTLDKKANQFTEEPQTEDSLRKLVSNDVLWTWSAFLDSAFLKPVTDARAGASRKLKGVPVKELNVARGQKLATLFVDDQLGYARGSTYQEERGGQKVATIVMATEIVLGKDTLAPGDKAFAMPTGAQKVEKLAAASGWKQVGPIFSANCGCHVSRVTAGLSLANYKGVMTGSRSGEIVVPGDPDNSILIQVIKGSRAPKMPPQGNLSAAQIETLTQWIKDGAKE